MNTFKKLLLVTLCGISALNATGPEIETITDEASSPSPKKIDSKKTGEKKSFFTLRNAGIATILVALLGVAGYHWKQSRQSAADNE